MAVESFLSRYAGRVTEAALRLRQPARRIAGTVRSAVTIGSIIVGVYNLTVGSVYTRTAWWYRGEVSTLIQTSAGFAFIMAIIDIAVIFGVLVRDDKILQYILCSAMALYMVCAPLSVCTFLGVAISGYYDIPLWEVPRFGATMLHLALMYCLLAELRGDPLPPYVSDSPATDGWLKNNLAHAGPPQPAGDEALLKVHVDNNNARAGGGPAVFVPSSCTTATPVHPSYPHPGAAAAAAATASGPSSTSEA